MKTIHSRILSALAILSTAILPPGANAQTATTVPVGFMTYPLTNGVTSAIGIPLLDTPVFSGVISAASATTITATGVSWSNNQFASPGSPYFVTIKTGAQAGRTLLVTANTASSVTIDVEDTPLDSAGFAVVSSSDAFDLFPGETLGSLFGTVATSGVLPSGIQGGASAFSADGVQVYNGTRFVTYFFNTTLGNWVMINGGSTNQNGFVLYPDEGLLILRRGPSTTLTVLGRVPSTALLTKLPGGTGNAVAIRFPTDTTLGGLNFTGPGVWITGANAFLADTIGLFNGTRWVSYFKNGGAQWIQVNGNGTDQSGVVIPAGGVIQVLKRGSATGSASFYTQALPYAP